MAVDIDAPSDTLRPLPTPPRHRKAIVLAVLIGIGVGSVTTWWIVHPQPMDVFPVHVLDGNAWFDADHVKFALLDENSEFIQGFKVGSAEGQECIPRPDAVSPDPIFMRVRIGVVRVSVDNGWRDLLVWIRCLGPPMAP